MIERKRILFEQEDEGPEWVVTYHLGYSEFDDDFESAETKEVVLNAPDFDTAVRFAQQYLRKMQTEEKTSEEWANSEILAIELH